MARKMPRLPIKGTVGRPKRGGAGFHPSMPGYARQIAHDMQQVERLYAEFIQGVGNVTPDVLKFGLEPAFERSQKYVPVKTGVLKESGYLEVRRRRGMVQAELGYAKGGDPSYAVIVHEKPARHQPPTKYKWLQFALEETFEEVQKRIIQAYRIATRLGNA